MKKEFVVANQHPTAPLSPTDSPSPVPGRVMRECRAIGVAGVAMLAACTTSPIASADYPADKKKYDDCVAREKDRVAGAPNPAYYRDTIRNFCGEPPTAAKGEEK